MKKVIRITESDLKNLVKSVIKEQSSNSSREEFNRLNSKLSQKYREICKYDSIKGKPGAVMLNTSGKVYPYDSEVEKLQKLNNQINPKHQVKVDGQIGPEMKRFFCTLS